MILKTFILLLVSTPAFSQITLDKHGKISYEIDNNGISSNSIYRHEQNQRASKLTDSILRTKFISLAQSEDVVCGATVNLRGLCWVVSTIGRPWDPQLNFSHKAQFSFDYGKVYELHSHYMGKVFCSLNYEGNGKCLKLSIDSGTLKIIETVSTPKSAGPVILVSPGIDQGGNLFGCLINFKHEVVCFNQLNDRIPVPEVFKLKKFNNILNVDSLMVGITIDMKLIFSEESKKTEEISNLTDNKKIIDMKYSGYHKSLCVTDQSLEEFCIEI
ncbi:hypothetical protein N9N67_04850 [Bacteriovoracaceae bacterium]|nr:hypothetical protein [Bacteriovoracaceae bacterium]